MCAGEVAQVLPQEHQSIQTADREGEYIEVIREQAGQELDSQVMTPGKNNHRTIAILWKDEFLYQKTTGNGAVKLFNHPGLDTGLDQFDQTSNFQLHEMVAHPGRVFPENIAQHGQRGGASHQLPKDRTPARVGQEFELFK